MVNWTKEQTECIEHRGCDVLVSAAAGSGKTAVLVERVIRLVCDEGIDIDRLLIVTFTNAAAAQMKAKVEKAIHDKLREMPENRHLQRQLQRLNRAKITTVHSFCMDLIRENFHLCGLSPDFTVADAQEAQLLKNESIFEAMETFFEDEQRAAGFAKFLDCFCKGKDTECEVLLSKTYDFVRAIPFYQDWLYERVMQYHNVTGLENTDFYTLILQDISEQLETVNEFFALWEEQLKDAEADGLLAYAETLEEDRAQLSRLDISGSYRKMSEQFRKISFGRLKPPKKEYHRQRAERVKACREVIKKTINDIKEHYFYDTEENILRCINDVFPELFTFYELILLTDTIYTEKKKKKNVVDFNDLEHKAITVLTQDGGRSEKAEELSEFYREILIDEYQDSNDVQELIFSRIAKDNLFMVGDIKQSIYKFRNAKPELFLDKYNRFAETNFNENRKILLSRNFRSRPEILEFTNFIFEHIMSEQTGGISYSEKEKLYPGAAYPEKTIPIEVHILDDPSDDDFTVTPKMKEAQLIADRIERMVGREEVFDNGEMRKIDYSDILVLYRATAVNGQILSDELTRRNIPHFCEGQGDYFGRYEVKLMLSMLQVVDNPRNDIPLCAVLYSPLYAFSDDDLAEIRMGEDGDFYDCVRKAAENGNQKCIAFLESLKEYRTFRYHHTIEELINRILADTGYLYYILQKPDGMLKYDNIQKLCEIAKRYESTVYKGLYSFINYVNLLIQSQTKVSETRAPGKNCVTIMSIHKSKGLESNVVIIGGTGGKINKMDTYAPVLLDSEMGIGCNFKNTENNSVIKTIYKAAIAEKQKKEIIAEELRIFYVALTRAKQKLILTGTSRDLNREIESVRKTISGQGKQPFAVKKANSYLQYFLIAALFMQQADFLEKAAEKPCSFTLDTKVYKDFQGGTAEVAESEPEEELIFTEEEIREVLDFTYPDVSAVPKKLSVSEIKRKYEIIEDGDDLAFLAKTESDPSLPRIEDALFLREKKLTPAQKGTALHTFIEHMGFDKAVDLQSLAQYLTDKNILTQAEKNTLNFEMIERFRKSRLFQEIADAESIHQEQSFLTELPAKALYPAAETDDSIMIQGTIDCWFESDGKIKIVDFKTDRYSNPQEILERYRGQLELYRYALEKLLDRKIDECLLYLFYGGDVVKIDKKELI